MSIPVITPSRPRGLLKWFFLLPRYLYRWHLGWLLGHRFLMITHIGRTTGLIRQTVVEAASYDPKTQTCLVVAGYGEWADWYRNIQVHPAVEIQIANRRYVPQQRLLSQEELLVLLRSYEKRHPRVFRVLLQALGYSYNGIPQELQAVAQVLRGVEFCPHVGQNI